MIAYMNIVFERLQSCDYIDCCIFILQLLSDVEEHLDVTIEAVEPDMKVPINEFDGKVTYGQKRKTGIDDADKQIMRDCACFNPFPHNDTF